eukprot:5258884-Pyramimonas_sp.AAC.1
MGVGELLALPRFSSSMILSAYFLLPVKNMPSSTLTRPPFRCWYFAPALSNLLTLILTLLPSSVVNA